MASVESVGPDLGARMKARREARGVSLRQIADATNISIGSLEALERNDGSRPPGGIFTRSFVRSYALEVGLDPEQASCDLLAQFSHDSVTAGSAHAAPHDRPGTRRRRRAIAAVLTVSLLVGVILFFTLSPLP